MFYIILEADYRSIGLGIAAFVFIAFIFLFFLNTQRARGEEGSEIELAPNRKPYYDDEDLEGKRLDRSLTFALVSLCFIAVAFSFYMIAEPGRQEGAVAAKEATFVERGRENYVVNAQCVNCHAADASGGGAAYVLQDGDGQFIANATWTAPALNNVLLRYSEEEVEYILNYGRSGSPMAAWGAPGGGPLTDQAVRNTITYLKTLQIQSIDPADIAAEGDDNPDNNKGDLEDEESKEAQVEADELTASIREEVERSIADGEFKTKGEAVFNLGLYSGFGSGSYSCARCHTAGWSLGVDVSPNVLEPGEAGCGGGVTGIGFNLCGGSVKKRFPDDTWKKADGSWPPAGGLVDSDGRHYIEDADGNKILLNDQSQPIDENGDVYMILSSELVSSKLKVAPAISANQEEDKAEDEKQNTDSNATPEDESDQAAEESDSDVKVEIVNEDDNTSQRSGTAGDLAKCDFVSGLFTPENGATYPVDPNIKPKDDSKEDPPPLDLTQFTGPIYNLDNGRIASGCEVIDMPNRTSLAHYNFVYNGAEAGKGYGSGGQSSAGMMPGFGKMLPPEYIQAVVDYERSLK